MVKVDTEEEKYSICPEGWKLAEFGDALEVKYGKGLHKKARKPNGVPVYGSNGIIGQHNVPLTKGPRIIIGRKGSVGRVHFSEVPCWPIDTTYFMDEFKGFDPAFIVYALRSVNLSSLDTSTAIPGLNRYDLYNQKIPQPPAEEQKRIVAKLEELLPKVNAVRERLNRVKEIMKRFRQSVLSAACSGRLTEDWRENQSLTEDNKRGLDGIEPNRLEIGEASKLPASWTRAPLDQVCDEIVDCPHSTPKWAKDGEICVRTTNFLPGFLDLSQVRYVSKETSKQRTERLKPMPGDILYSREGGILGIACMIPEGARVCLGQRMMLMRTDATRCISAYLMHRLNSPQIQQIASELTGRSASPHLNVKDIKKFPVLVPPLIEQGEIVRRVDSLFKMSDRIENLVEAGVVRAEKMTQTVLAKAFRGELVPTEAARVGG